MTDDSKKNKAQSLQRLKRLVDLMNANSLVELELEEENFRVRLVKAQPKLSFTSGYDERTSTFAALDAISPKAVAPAKPSEASDDAGYIKIKSPIVGTFYQAPAPDAPAYVKVGDRVTPDTVVCIVEAMKVMNELKAECSGTIAKISAENAQTVEYGQVLFLVKPD